MSLDDELQAEVEALARLGRRRELDKVRPRPDLLDFVSNDYLGLATEPEVLAAAATALQTEGLGGRAARLLGGGGDHSAALEGEVAEWLGAEAALLFPSGYQANVGLLPAICGRRDVIVSDSRIHASLVDAARLSRAQVLVHRHLDLDHARKQLRAGRNARRRIVLTEGIFSMDGDRPDLTALLELCAEEDAWLVVDEAHSVGLLGPQGAGACAEVFGRVRPGRLLARIVTGGKALGAQGALVVGSRSLRDLLVNRSRSFVFTTAPGPVIVAGLRAAVAQLRRDEDRRRRPLELARRLAEELQLPAPAAAIVPVPVGGERAAIGLQAALADAGFDARAVRPPTVPEGSCRVRVVCRAGHDEEQVDALAAAIREHRPPLAPVQAPLPPRTRPWFVCGTDTGVGKTVVSALVLRAMRRGLGGSYWKPVQTGDDDDTQTVADLCEIRAETLPPPAFALPLPASPHEAAADAGVRIELTEIEARLAELSAEGEWLVELAGGLCVPYGDGNLQIDWLARLAPRIVLVARSGLGTLNHTLLSLDLLRRRGLEPEILVLVGERHPSNFATLTELGQVPLTVELPPMPELKPAQLDAWLDRQPAFVEALQPRS